MTIVLMAVGLLATAAGLMTIGFGIPINAFSLGNTLIISGTVAVSVGLILIALSLLHGKLRRINEPLRGRSPLRATELANVFVAKPPRLPTELTSTQPSLPD